MLIININTHLHTDARTFVRLSYDMCHRAYVILPNSTAHRPKKDTPSCAFSYFHMYSLVVSELCGREKPGHFFGKNLIDGFKRRRSDNIDKLSRLDSKPRA